MRRSIVHLLVVALYAALAVAVALEAGYWVAPLAALHPLVLAALLFLAAALAHTGLLLGRRNATVNARLDVLAHTVAAQGAEIAALQDALAAQRPASDHAGGAMAPSEDGEMRAEITMLRSLVARLSEHPRAAPDAASDVAAEARVNAAPPPQPAATAVLTASPGGRPDAHDAPLAVVREALRDDRVDLVLQPIVSLPQRKRRFYECFSRLRTQDGQTILPDQYIAMAERAGLITAIDNMLLFRCIQIIRKIQRRNQNADFFCNLSPHTLADEDFFADFVEFLEANRDLAANLVFEFAQADFKRWSTVGALLLERLSKLGCRFSLDQVRDLDLDPDELARQRISFVKVEAARLLEALQDNTRLIRSLRRLEIDVIAEKLESEGRLLDLLDYGIDYGQGYLFGEPRLARPAA